MPVNNDTGYVQISSPGFLWLLANMPVVAQHNITGNVKNAKGEVVPFASVTIAATRAGARTDSAGNFRFAVSQAGKLQLSVSSVGYHTYRQEIILSDSLYLELILQPDARVLNEVTVSAGTFDASDKAKGASLTPMDAVTVAGSNADITQALRSLPGAQQIGEQEGLFVRGGTSDETRQFIDGTWLKNPNYPSVPGVMQNARINPFLFKGILFSSGGYSALYGQAMSSALIMESVDLPDKTSASIHLFPANIGVGGQVLSKNNRISYGINVNYNNQVLYNSVIKQRPDYFSGPSYFQRDANFRMKTGKTGMLKLYVNWSSSDVGMNNPDIDSAAYRSHYQVTGRNLYNNLSYRTLLPAGWKLDLGLAYSYDRNHTTNGLIDSAGSKVWSAKEPYIYKNTQRLISSDFAQARVLFTRRLARNQALRFGAEHFYIHDHGKINDSLIAFTDQLTAVFAEGDITLAHHLAAKVGVRMEYATAISHSVIAPRVSIAYRMPDGGQLNLAYGIFYQEPANDLLYHNTTLDFQRATHYVLNYTKKAGNRFFRVEAYYKDYNRLVKMMPAAGSTGTGYAKGVELFFRDKRSIRNLDYWITYTYLDTKRDYMSYPYALQPTFAAPHTATIAVKKQFPDINTYVNISYAVAAGRPYYDIRSVPDNSGWQLYQEGTTRPYSVVNLHVAYLTSLFPRWKNRDFSGIACGVNNLLGTPQVFGYNYSYNGMHKVPVTLPAARSFFIGVFMNLGIDRTQDFLDNNL